MDTLLEGNATGVTDFPITVIAAVVSALAVSIIASIALSGHVKRRRIERPFYERLSSICDQLEAAYNRIEHGVPLPADEMEQLGLGDLDHSLRVLRGQLPGLHTELVLASQAVRLLASGGLPSAAASNPTVVVRTRDQQQVDVSELRRVVAALRKKIRKRVAD